VINFPFPKLNSIFIKKIKFLYIGINFIKKMNYTRGRKPDNNNDDYEKDIEKSIREGKN
jgi:hypothetical protein